MLGFQFSLMFICRQKQKQKQKKMERLEIGLNTAYFKHVGHVYDILPKGHSIVKLDSEAIFHETEEGCKTWGESTCSFKIDIRNLTNFDLSTRKSQKFSL